jgi:oligopeptide/dipeptide ABC transporter ATP-binding protein
LFSRPQHPYTEALLSAVPVPDPEAAKKRIILRGDVPSPINPPSGCRFHTRCPYAFDRCSQEEPPMQEVLPGQFVACHLRDSGPAPRTAVVPGAGQSPSHAPREREGPAAKRWEGEGL